MILYWLDQLFHQKYLSPTCFVKINYWQESKKYGDLCVYWKKWKSSLFGSVQDRTRLYGFFKLYGKMKFPKLPKQHSKLLKHVLQDPSVPSGFYTSPGNYAGLFIEHDVH